VGIAELALPLHELAQPIEAALVLGAKLSARALVFPVRGDAELGVVVHGAGANLNLHALPIGADHRGVQRLVGVGLGQSHIILEAPRHRRPGCVNQSQCVIHRFAAALQHQAEGNHIVNFVEGLAAPLHLGVNGGQILLPPAHLARNAGFGELLREHALHLLDIALALLMAAMQGIFELGRGGGMQPAEGAVFELALHPMNAEAIRQRHINIAGLLGDAAGLFLIQVMQRAHIVQSVGQLDQQNADILGHGHQHFAEVLRLPRTRRAEFHLRDFREPLDQKSHLCAKQRLQFLRRGQRVFHGVVQQARRNGHLVEPHFGQHAGHLERVHQVGLSREPLLSLVHLGGIHIGPLQQRQVAIGVVGKHPIRNVVEAQHGIRLPAAGELRSAGGHIQRRLQCLLKWAIAHSCERLPFMELQAVHSS